MINPAEALIAGIEVVDAANEAAPGRKRLGPAEYVRLSLEVADFLAYSQATEEPTSQEQETGDNPPPAGDAVPVGPTRRVECEASPGDYAYVRAGRAAPSTPGRPFVVIENVMDGERASLVLSPAVARSYAAGILDAADEAEGRSPLLRFDLGADPE
ncbi:hypothetical protein Acy02nite_68290 [Actinoplanes cyaneus]|uniref:Uncharacterized protein n=1 Tax=Actinoplanes cyaneus TaxID=52696 RepID=A0A919M905_9ACTN|nr:hypothetical protein [Actinoplanes cyaneus]MCW2139119.1 hypothetical protein [Actinoplanes cyaneus]GID68948.1 hypothetical protein Acy02nite_68290 [Actinoplanes cyaneus]